MQSQLNQAAAGLNQSANELVQASRGTPQDLAKSSGKFGHDFNEFLQAGVEMAGQSPVRGNTCWGILSSGNYLRDLGRWLTKVRVDRQWLLGWLCSVELGRWGTGAVQNHSNREKVTWVSSARIHVSLLLVEKLNYLRLKIPREDPGWVWTFKSYCTKLILASCRIRRTRHRWCRT